MTRFMSERDVADATERYHDHPVLGPATRTLANLVEATNSNSDGWPYYEKPNRAAGKLVDLIYGPDGYAGWDDTRQDATASALRLALTPIKRFRTRSGWDFTIEDGTTPAPVQVKPAVHIPPLYAEIDPDELRRMADQLEKNSDANLEVNAWNGATGHLATIYLNAPCPDDHLL